MKRFLALALLAAACGKAEGAGSPPAAAMVDSVFTREESLARLRSGLEAPAQLAAGATSRNALVDSLLAALERRDTAAAVALHLTRAEFAWLYYPHSRAPGGGEQMDPGLMWTMLRLESEKGLGRLFTRLGGQALGGAELACEPAPRVEGPSLLWEECRVRLTGAGVGGTRLFGTIIEQEGRFRFVSYATDL